MIREQEIEKLPKNPYVTPQKQIAYVQAQQDMLDAGYCLLPVPSENKELVDNAKLQISRIGEIIEESKQVGRREVVEWGNEPCPHEDSTVEILDDSGENAIGERPFAKRECYKCWQTKLKEWNL
jgi:hypothetical protein